MKRLHITILSILFIFGSYQAIARPEKSDPRGSYSKGSKAKGSRVKGSRAKGSRAKGSRNKRTPKESIPKVPLPSCSDNDFGGPDKGLPGGHFDLDVFVDGVRVHHTHRYDDKYNVTSLDLIESVSLDAEWIKLQSRVKWAVIKFQNSNNGSGKYELSTDNTTWSGNTKNNKLGYVRVYLEDIKEFELNFISLKHFRGTDPSAVKNDNINRDGAMSVNIYNLAGRLVYQMSVYEHIKNDKNGSNKENKPKVPCFKKKFNYQVFRP